MLYFNVLPIKMGIPAFIFVLAVLFQNNALGQTVPVIEVDKIVSITNTDYDMGRIPSGKPLEYSLIIKNISKDTVLLQEVKVGCGCTSPKYKAGEKIFPGMSTFITLGFNGGASGEFVKTADIFFSGGLSKTVRFHGMAITDSTQIPKPVGLNKK